MSELMKQPFMLEGIVFIGGLLVVGLLFMAFGNKRGDRIARRVERIKQRKSATHISKNTDGGSLRRKTEDNSMRGMGKLVRMLPNLEMLRARLEKAGSALSAE